MTKRTFMIRTCGHEVDVTNLPGERPAVGDQVTCWSSCDGVMRWRGRDEDNPWMPRVARYEEREV